MIRALLTCVYFMTATGAAYGQAEEMVDHASG